MRAHVFVGGFAGAGRGGVGGAAEGALAGIGAAGRGDLGLAGERVVSDRVAELSGE